MRQVKWGKKILLNARNFKTSSTKGLMYIQIFILVKVAFLLEKCYWNVIFTVWETGRFTVEKFFKYYFTLSDHLQIFLF